MVRLLEILSLIGMSNWRSFLLYKKARIISLKFNYKNISYTNQSLNKSGAQRGACVRTHLYKN